MECLFCGKGSSWKVLRLRARLSERGKKGLASARFQGLRRQGTPHKSFLPLSSYCVSRMSYIKGLSSFKDLDIHFNQDGWGPQAGENPFSVFGIPYSHFDKKEKIGRPADFTVQTAQASSSRQHHQRRRDDHHGADIAYKFDATEDATFQLVDSAKNTSKAKHSSKHRSSSHYHLLNPFNMLCLLDFF